MSSAGSSSTQSLDDLRPPAGHKRGKRIVHLLQEHRDQLQKQRQPSPQEHLIKPPGTAGRDNHQSQPSGNSVRHAACNLSALLPSGSSHATSRSAQPNRQSLTSHNLLEVESLTRDALDSCVSAFFEISGPAYVLSQPREVVIRRIQVLLYNLAGLDAPGPMVNEPPASELLVVAIAAVGAPFSLFPQLAQPLFHRCCALMTNNSSLLDDPLDATEAILLLEGASVSSQPFIGTSLEGTRPNPLRLNPLGSGFAVDLAKFHSLHIAPSTQAQPDYERRKSLFWILWEADALRAVSTGSPCRLSDSDIGWPQPLVPASSSYQWDLVKIGRQISASLLSPRAKSQSQLDHALLSALDALDGTRLPSLSGDGSQASIPAAAETAVILSTHNLLYLVCWRALRHQGTAIADDALSCLEAAVRTATGRMANLAASVVKGRLLHNSPKVIRDHMVAFALYLLQSFSHPSWLDDNSGMQRMRWAASILDAVRSASAHRDSSRLADALWQAIRRASGTTTTNGSSDRHVGSSNRAQPSNSTAPTPLTPPLPWTPATLLSREAQQTAALPGTATLSSSIPLSPKTDSHMASHSRVDFNHHLFPAIGGALSAAEEGGVKAMTAGHASDSATDPFAASSNTVQERSAPTPQSSREPGFLKETCDVFDEDLLAFAAAWGVEVSL